MAPKIYKSSYPDIALPDIDVVSWLFTNDANISPNHPIYIDGRTGETRTYQDVKERTRSLASALRTLSVQPDDVVALYSPNTVDYPIICYAIIGCGATVSPVSAASTHLELQHQLTTAGARYLVAHSTLLSIASQAIQQCPLVETLIQADTTTSSAAAAAPSPKLHPSTAQSLSTSTPPAPLTTTPPSKTHTALAFLPFSSGTTSLPKGVMTTHFNIVSNLLQWRHHCPGQCAPGQNWIAFLPFSHIYGLHYMVLQPMKFGCTAVVMPRFDMAAFLALVSKYRVQTLSLVPPVVLGLVNVWDELVGKRTAAGKGCDLSSVKRMVSAAAPLSAALTRAIEGKFKTEYGTEVSVLQCWGLTETSPLCTAEPEGEEGRRLAKRRGSVGNLTPNMEMRVVDPDSGIDVGWDETEEKSMPGEFWVRGPNVCAGYYRNEEATQNGFSVDEEGGKWFRTGDIGTIDRDGFVRVVDRMKELVKFHGFQVIPSELEGKLLEHPHVVDACVVGVYVEKIATEVPVGFVVLKQDTECGKSREDVVAEVKAWLEAKIAGHKKLRGGLFAVESVPKSSSGKILRRQLKAGWEKRVKAAVESSSSSKL